MLKFFLLVCLACPVPQLSHIFGIDWSYVPGTCAKCIHVLLLLILSRVYEVCIIKFILWMWTVRFSCGSSSYGRMRTIVPTQVSNVGRPTCILTSTEPPPREVLGNSAGPSQPVWTTSTSHFLDAECWHQSGELLLLPTLSSSSCLCLECAQSLLEPEDIRVYFAIALWGIMGCLRLFLGIDFQLHSCASGWMCVGGILV